MLRVLSCLAYEHDYRFVLVAALVCLAATVTAMRLYARAYTAFGSAKAAWLLFTGLAAGAGVWATHFIAMLAYDPGFETGYEPVGTALSLALPVVVLTLSFAVASGPRTPRTIGGAGLLFGAGVAAMHYTGMNAFRTMGSITWDPWLVGASVLLGAALATGAFACAVGARTWKRWLAGAGLLTAGICTLHFTAMGAALVTPDPTVVVPPQLVSPPVLTMAVVALVALILMGAAGTIVIDAGTRHGQGRLVDAINAMPEGVAWFDAQGRCFAWNAPYAELLGDAGRLLRPGVAFEDLLRAGVAEGHYPDAAGGPEGWIRERLARRREGGVCEQRLADGRWLRVADQRTRDGGTVTTCVDITDLKQRVLELEAARDAAAAADRRKGELLINLGRRMGASLQSVIGLAETCAAGEAEGPRRKLIETARGTAAGMERMVADAGELSRDHAGERALQAAPFRPADAVNDVARLWQETARAKGLRLNVEIAPEADRLVSGDALRLRRILNALVGNAVEYTDAGFVRIGLACEGEVFRFLVRDSGPGFDLGPGETVFRPWPETGGSAARPFGASGLGLLASKQLAGTMGGDLEVRTLRGTGSAFTLSVPLRVLQERASEPAKAAV